MMSGEPGIRLTFPPDLRHAALVRACIRDAASFRSDDAESSYLVAVTEIVVNAIEASAGSSRSSAPGGLPVVVELWSGSDARVEVHDRVGSSEYGTVKPDHLGAGLTIAEAFVSGLTVDTTPRGTTVRLPLREAST